MSNTVFDTRIALKIDTFENWMATNQPNKGANLILKRREIGLCEIPADSTSATTAPTILFKVGDGVTPFSNLSWGSAPAADVYSQSRKTRMGYYWSSR